MTEKQRKCLKNIIGEIEMAPNHHSPWVKSDIGKFAKEEVEHALQIIDETLDQDDGHMAHQIIKKWIGTDFSGVIEFLKAY